MTGDKGTIKRLPRALGYLALLVDKGIGMVIILVSAVLGIALPLSSFNG